MNERKCHSFGKQEATNSTAREESLTLLELQPGTPIGAITNLYHPPTQYQILQSSLNAGAHRDYKINMQIHFVKQLEDENGKSFWSTLQYPALRLRHSITSDRRRRRQALPHCHCHSLVCPSRQLSIDATAKANEFQLVGVLCCCFVFLFGMATRRSNNADSY